MSFVRVKKAQAIKAEDLKGPETVSTGSLATTLTETNKILAEIQNQLAIDFANRIAEKKQTLKLSRKTGRKKKLGEKEEFVERGTKLQKSANAFGKKVLAPIKSIFDKLLDFLTIVGGGILLNAAWVWLQDEENREKLVKIFTFLKTYWKEILVGLLTLKVVSAIGKLVGFALTLRKLFKKLRGLGRRPPGAGGTRGINPQSPSGGCGPVTGKGGCLDQLNPKSEVAGNLARTLFATGVAGNFFKKFATKEDLNIFKKTQPQEQSQEQSEEETQQKPKGIPMIPLGPKLPPKTTSPSSPPPSSTIPKNRVVPFNRPSVTKPKVPTSVANFRSGLPVSGRAGILTMLGGFALSELSNKLDEEELTRLENLRQSNPQEYQKSISKLRRAAQTEKFMNPLMEILGAPAPPRAYLLKALGELREEDIPLSIMNSVLPESKKLTPDIDDKGNKLVNHQKSQGYSRGGTVFGKGSQTVDSVPAMLAPGEEVIRSSASNIFRPVLKDINDNAGRMFIAFRDATNRMTKNNVLQADETSRSLTLFEKFKDLLDDQIQKIELEQFKEAAKNTLLVNGPTNNNNTGRTILLSNTQQQSNATQNLLNQPQTEPQTQTLKVSLNAPTVDLNRYNLTRNRRTDSGEGSIQTLSMNLPGTVVDARTPTQARPEEQPTDSSSTDIIIAPMDGNNPFFSRSLSAYGVDFT